MKPPPIRDGAVERNNPYEYVIPVFVVHRSFGVCFMTLLAFTLRSVGLFALARMVLPAVREVAQETLAQARERYRTGRYNTALIPSVARLDPAVLTRLAPFVPSGRLARLLVAARPMGP